MSKAVLAVMALAVLAACGDGRLRDLSTDSAGPDEFSVIPQRPLEIPQTLTLPPPTPGGTNPADPNPKGNAIAALGGSQAAAFAGGVPTSDAALVGYAARNGVAPGIRAILAQEDAAFRAGRATLSAFNPFGRDRYFSSYAGQSLDAYAELQRFRNLGVATPSAPPPAQ